MSVAPQQDKAVDSRAVAWTVGPHELLLLLLFFITYKVPEMESPEDMGMEVNLGTSLDGYGTNQPMSIGEPAPDNATSTSMSTTAQTDLPADIVESDDPEAPAVSTTETKKANTTNPANINRPGRNDRPANNNTTPTQKARYVYGGSTGTGGNGANTDAEGGSEGNTTGNSDRGVPGGTPGASNYEGTPGSGGGINHELTGRNIVAYPPRDAEFKEGGQVTVRITVNRQGIITDRRIVSSSNSQLREIALKKVSSIRFNKSDSAPEEQFGNITFVFKTRS